MDQPKAKILLVDDRPENLQALEAAIADESFDLVFAHSGEEALKKILNEDFAVILLDVQMPGLNGFETAKLIKGRRLSAHIPIIFITALSKADEHINEGYVTGAVDYIFKPFNRKILKSKIKVFVDIYLKQKQIETERNKLALQQLDLKKQFANLENLVEEKTKEVIQKNKDLQISKDSFQKIFQSSPILKVIRSLDTGQYINVNNTWVEHVGYTIEELNNVNTINFIVANSAAPLDLMVGLTNEKIQYKTKQNKLRDGLLSTEKIIIDGKLCILSAITDITELTKLEKAISRLDSLHLVGEMAAGIAHEIRNPMTTVIGFLQIAKNDLGSPISEEYINLMLSELKRANGIITEFLTLAKDKVNDKKVEDLNSIITNISPLLLAEGLMSSKDVQLKLGNIPTMIVDEKEIRQMLLNLSLNGLEAMAPGGTLTIKTYVTKEEQVVIEVNDEGPGMKNEVLEKIGTPFFTTKEKGTGLGLAICFSIALRHNAEINVKTSDKGTSFFICFTNKEHV